MLLVHSLFLFSLYMKTDFFISKMCKSVFEVAASARWILVVIKICEWVGWLVSGPTTFYAFPEPEHWQEWKWASKSNHELKLGTLELECGCIHWKNCTLVWQMIDCEVFWLIFWSSHWGQHIRNCYECLYKICFILLIAGETRIHLHTKTEVTHVILQVCNESVDIHPCSSWSCYQLLFFILLWWLKTNTNSNS